MGTLRRAVQTAAVLTLAATPSTPAQSALPPEGYGYMHVTLRSMIMNCMSSQPNFEWTTFANTLSDVRRVDMGAGLTVLRDAPSLGRSELHTQTIVDGVDTASRSRRMPASRPCQSVSWTFNSAA